MCLDVPVSHENSHGLSTGWLVTYVACRRRSCETERTDERAKWHISEPLVCAGCGSHTLSSGISHHPAPS